MSVCWVSLLIIGLVMAACSPTPLSPDRRKGEMGNEMVER
jgi:hypothetical protein